MPLRRPRRPRPPRRELLLAPLADGGEGTLVAIEAAGGWERRAAAAHDPLGRPLNVPWLIAAEGGWAVVEMAAASGLSRVAPADRDPIAADTVGTSEVLRAVLDAGVRRIDLGVGGSATTAGALAVALPRPGAHALLAPQCGPKVGPDILLPGQ